MTSKAVAVATKQHAELGASVAGRWMNCAGSVQLIRSLPDTMRGGTSAFAQEGTAAHALGEISLKRKTDPGMWAGLELEGVLVSDAMVEFTRVYYEFCRDLMARCTTGGVVEYWIEKKFNLAPLDPPAPMFGTSDFVGYERAEKTLHVVDLKFGQGVLVEVKKSKQLLYYALGALLETDLSKYPVEKVVITIVQPRMAHTDGTIRSDEFTLEQVLDFAMELLAAARATQEPGAPLTAGDHCRFCPAQPLCPERRNAVIEAAQADFTVEGVTLPAVEMLSEEVFLRSLASAGKIEAWIKSLRAHALDRLARGEEVPGFKVVEKRGIRKWTDEATAKQYLKSEGFTPEEYHVEPKLRSVAQIEKIFGGKKKFTASPLTGLVEKKSSGYTMVADSDARPAITIERGEEFAALLSGSSDETAGAGGE